MKQREEFEAWFFDEHTPESRERISNAEYCNYNVQNAWLVWQAAASPQPVQPSQARELNDETRIVLVRALQAISAATFGTDTYKVSSRGDFVSKVEKEIQAVLAAINAKGPTT